MKKFLYDNRFRIIDIACVVLIASIFLLWLMRITADMNNILAGPDEAMRYIIPSFIYEHGRLPDGYETAIHGNWSYAFYPQLLGAIISTGFMHVVSLFTHDPEWLVRAARLTSVVFGIIAAIFVRRSARLLFQSSKHKVAIGNLAMILFALLPQVTFLSSYVNNDIVALAGVSIIIYSCIYIYKKGISIPTLIWFAVGAIFAVLGYLNSYGFVLAGFVYILLHVIRAYRRTNNRRKLITYIAIIAGIPALVCLPFFIRNGILYNGDIFGLNTFRSAYLSWVAETGKQLQFPYKEGLVQLTIGSRWGIDTLKSFVMGYFGGWSKGVSTIQYLAYYLIALISAVGFVVYLKATKVDKEKVLLISMIALGSLITVGLSIYYTLRIDYQPQGRYVIYLWIPIVLGATIGLYRVLQEFIKTRYVKLAIVLLIILYVLLHVSIMYKSLF